MPPGRKAPPANSNPHPAKSNPHPANPNAQPSTTILGKTTTATATATAAAAARPRHELTPGRKAAAHLQQEVAAAPLTDYEKGRAKNIMQNHRVFRSLGITDLSSLLKNARAIVEDEGPQKSGSEYEPQDNEEYEEEVSKSVNIHAKGRKGSKRVMLPRQQCEPRVTRQRTATTLSLTASTEDALVTPSSPIQNEDLNPIGDEDALAESLEQGRRGRSMGHGLERITKGLKNKICINISEGKRRPEAPLESAKFASEGGIAIRNHVPIFPHWKHYKTKENESEIVNYIGKLAGQFTMDHKTKAVKDACIDLLKGGQRQMRYRLKMKYFNGLSENQVRKTSLVSSMTDEQWLELVNMWSKSEHKVQQGERRGMVGGSRISNILGCSLKAQHGWRLQDHIFWDVVCSKINLVTILASYLGYVF